MKKKISAEHFCSCIKKVKRTLKQKKNKEGISIAICVKSILQTKGRTLKKFHCKKHPMLKTQKIKNRI
jgi:hypothetical protein